ncbi:hypothetical protein ACQPYE_02535 [Actinosynnema sp. CA-299493]
MVERSLECSTTSVNPASASIEQRSSTPDPRVAERSADFPWWIERTMKDL